MKKFYKYALILLIFFTACEKKDTLSDETLDDINYPIYQIEDYNKMETYTFSETVNSVKYEYTFFFDDGKCVNSKEELTFKDNSSAKEFYEEINNIEDYNNVTINNNVVSYYNNPQYFIYMMYPKEVLIELLNSSDYLSETNY